MSKRLGLLVVFALLLSVVAIAPMSRSAAMGVEVMPDVTIDCMVITNTVEGFFYGDRDNTGQEAEVMYYEILDGNGTTLYLEGPYYDTMIFGIGTWHMVNDLGGDEPQANPVRLYAVSPAYEELPEERILLAEGYCEGLGEEVVAVPGCDVSLPLPDGSVVGSFVADADTYYEPGNLTNPLVTIGAGNTAWVIGKDASGAYYKIVWVCQYLWVPVGTMGPNYDAVWNGTPLPTGVVE